MRRFAQVITLCLGFAATAPVFSAGPVSNEKMTLRIGYQPLTPTWGISIIYQAKLWKRYLPNVEVERFETMSGMPLVNNLLAGKLDIGYLGDMPAIVLASKAQLLPTKFISVTDADRGGASVIYVAKGSPIKSIKELAGKKVSIPFGGYTHRFAEVVSTREGIKFEFVGQSPEVGLTALQAGRVDAYIPWPPYGPMAVAQGFGQKLVDGTNYKFNSLRGVVAAKEFLEKNPTIAVAWLRAELDAHKIMRERPDYAAKLIFEEWKNYKIPLEVIRGDFAFKQFPDEITEEWRKVLVEGAEFLRNNKLINAPIDFNTFIDDSYLKKAAAIPSQLNLSQIPKQ
jgi:NitT/TauT family transport system substrate-binding protein